MPLADNSVPSSTSLQEAGFGSLPDCGANLEKRQAAFFSRKIHISGLHYGQQNQLATSHSTCDKG
jgi:hypothetical protein